MKISTRARYALRLMIDLADHAQPGQPVVLKDIAARQQISKRYLEHLALSLKHANLVTVSSGRGGGYGLARPAGKIRIGEIVQATLGEVNVVECVGRPDLCDRTEQCPSRDMWALLNQRITETLNDVTLADLAERKLGFEPAHAERRGPLPCSSREMST